MFQKLSLQEIVGYTRPVNYITMVKALKNCPHTTTLLRICMNSSMKQPMPSGKSLNDCLMKGPSALVDLFTVTVCLREYQYALPMDLSKFYQRVQADELAHHVRLIIWCGGKLNRDPDVYMTTTVNFGDKPAGCMAIAATREMPRMFGSGKDDTAWFFTARTYVDDATARVNTLNELLKLSKEMEDIAACSGFTFKETMMSGDPVEDPSNPKKVLGLIWDTAVDRLWMNVKVNFSGKQKGVRVDPDADLEEKVDTFTLDHITKRMLWRVAQGQCDPLGLLLPYTIRLKLLIRGMTQENGKVTCWNEEVPAAVTDDFRVILEDMKMLRDITFPRSIMPPSQ